MTLSMTFCMLAFFIITFLMRVHVFTFAFIKVKHFFLFEKRVHRIYLVFYHTIQRGSKLIISEILRNYHNIICFIIIFVPDMPTVII